MGHQRKSDLLYTRNAIRRELLERKPHPEHRAAVIPIFCPYLPVMRFHQGARDGQPHAHPLRFAGEERFEDLSKFVFGNARPRSDTDNSANFLTRVVGRLIMQFSLGVSFIASIPFVTRFRMTC